jgi:hypothetical protein
LTWAIPRVSHTDGATTYYEIPSPLDFLYLVIASTVLLALHSYGALALILTVWGVACQQWIKLDPEYLTVKSIVRRRKRIEWSDVSGIDKVVAKGRTELVIQARDGQEFYFSMFRETESDKRQALMLDRMCAAITERMGG